MAHTQPSNLQEFIDWCQKFPGVAVVGAQLVHFANQQSPEIPGQVEEFFGGPLRYSSGQVHPFNFDSFNGNLFYIGNWNFSVNVSVTLTDPVAVAVRFVHGPEDGVSAYSSDTTFLSGVILGQADTGRPDFQGPQPNKNEPPDSYYLTLWRAFDFYKRLPFVEKAKIVHAKAHSRGTA